MKLEFKFGVANILSFVVICGLFYWLCPFPKVMLWRILVNALVVLFAFSVSFIVVTHKGFIQHTPQPRKRKNR